MQEDYVTTSSDFLVLLSGRLIGIIRVNFKVPWRACVLVRTARSIPVPNVSSRGRVYTQRLS